MAAVRTPKSISLTFAHACGETARYSIMPIIDDECEEEDEAAAPLFGSWTSEHPPFLVKGTGRGAYFPDSAWMSVEAFEAQALPRLTTGFNGWRLQALDDTPIDPPAPGAPLCSAKEAVLDIANNAIPSCSFIFIEYTHGRKGGFTMVLAVNSTITCSFELASHVPDTCEPPPFALCDECDAEWESIDSMDRDGYLSSLTTAHDGWAPISVSAAISRTSARVFVWRRRQAVRRTNPA